MYNTHAALDATHRVGLDDTTIALVREVFRPLTPDERAREARFQREIAAAGRVKADLDAVRKHMTFAQWAERRASGTLPSTR
jgi:hypothetical protein